MEVEDRREELKQDKTKKVLYIGTIGGNGSSETLNTQHFTCLLQRENVKGPFLPKQSILREHR